MGFRINDDCEYIAAFLTLKCNFNCSYCINKFGGPPSPCTDMTPEYWIAALSNLENLEREGGDVPVTLCGGEPSQYRGFYDIINGVPDRIKIDILTNLSFDIDEFMEKVRPERLKREAGYPSIRVSYHPEFHDMNDLLNRVEILHNAGYSIGIYAVSHPENMKDVLSMGVAAYDLGLYFREKPLLGPYEERMYGKYGYPNPFEAWNLQTVGCRTRELLVAPDGSIHRCHNNLYGNKNPIGHISSNEAMSDKIRICHEYGNCNPCDIKIKSTRHGEPGYLSVDIYDVFYKDKKNVEKKSYGKENCGTCAACG